ncbi:SusC/RagA family TonB-linked outer membrane protein [Capnocytophaga cynodegmi]|uniref:SusC/RagA family TonB-linked outer membrane protein n=1 Tax=Capnocytophaga cynodegmi TaxID=28189 RepID=UPI00385A5532
MEVLKKYVLSFVLLFSIVISLQAQNYSQVTGTVKDGSGVPLPGVSVIIKGTTKGISTDFDGKYELKDVPQGAILEFSYVGFKTIDVRVTGTIVNVKMSEEMQEIDEVIVVGYGTQKKGDVTTAITSVSTKDIDQRPVTSAAQAIQGRAAGVQVVQPNGAPGAGLSVRIRGNTSISASNDPLYVVDGVPVQDINNIAPTDIQDMQILKDASSSAIYGSRAANGVVLITTKQGKQGEAKVSINSYIGMSNIANKIESLNYAQYKELMDETKAATVPGGLTDVTDWHKETYRTGFNRNYQVSVSDANERTNYYLSAGYTKDDGIIRSSFFERYNVRLNLENKTKKWLTLGANISYSDYSSNNIISGQGSNRAGVVLSVINTPTYAPIWSDNPKQYYNNFYGVNITHPVENISRNADNSTNNNRFVGSGSATIHFTDALKFKSTFAIDRLAHKHTSWLDPEATAWGRQNFGSASDVRSNVTLLTFDNLLTFDKNFGKHSLSLLAGTSGTTSKYDESEIRGSHYASSDIKTLNAANKIDPNSTKTYASQWTMMSYLGRISYNYDGKYLLTANFRADGSSKLAPGKRWGYFPSISVGWRLSKENFLNDVAWLSDLKIRGGWGQVGNQAGIGPYGHLLLYSITRKDWWDSNNTNALVTISPTSFSNPGLTWETTTQSNIGIDIALFNNRLALTADAYLKRTTDLLMNVPLPATSPYPFVYRNEGEMTNKGLEFGINSRNFVGEDFNWNTSFNISFNRNKLEKLTLQKVYYYARTSERTNEYVVRMQEGMPLGQFWGRISEGVNPDTGDIVYRDVNGDGNVDSNDKTFIGDPNPDFTFGLTNDFTYKNFSLNIFLQGSYGNDIYNASRIEMEGMYDGKNQSTAVLNRWRTPGQITDIPRAIRGTNNIFASSRWVEDGSYLRVKSVTLSYNVPVQSLERLGVRKIQPYFTAQNLLTFTNYKGFDPEVNQFTGNEPIFGIDWGTYPQTKTFIFGLNVEF